MGSSRRCSRCASRGSEGRPALSPSAHRSCLCDVRPRCISARRRGTARRTTAPTCPASGSLEAALSARPRPISRCRRLPAPRAARPCDVLARRTRRAALESLEAACAPHCGLSPPPGIAWAASESLDQDVQVSARGQELDESRRISHQISRTSRSQVVEEALGTEKGPGTKLEERIDAICTELGLPEGADEV